MSLTLMRHSLLIFITTSLCLVFSVNRPAVADECSDVLEGQLHDEIRLSSNATASEIYGRQLFRMSEQEAYQEYLKVFNENVSGGGGARFSFPIKNIPIGFGLEGSGARQLSRQEFSERFNYWKQIVASQINSESSYDVSNYFRSYIRNERSIAAWETCMAQNRTGLFAYAYRNSDNESLLLRVVYRPQSRLRVQLEFIAPPGIDVAVDSGTEIFGSKNFLVTGSISNGFYIGVNGALLDNTDNPIGNIDTTVAVGPAELPEIQIYDWVESFNESAPAEGALFSGRADNVDLWVCRALHDGGYHPGKLFRHSELGYICNIGFGGQEIVKTNYQLLVDVSNPSWVGFSSRRSINPNIVFSNYVGSDNLALYVCRAFQNGGWHPGKMFIHPERGYICNIGWGGQEIVFEDFQVLTTN